MSGGRLTSSSRTEIWSSEPLGSRRTQVTVESNTDRESKIPEWARLLVWSALLALPFLGLRPLWLPDDGRYAEVAREMVTTGDWITPQLNSIPHYTKPPISYWVSAVGILLFGRNEFAVRLAVALPFIGCVLLTYLLVAEFRDKKTGFVAGLIFMTSPIPFIAANIITPDMMLTFFEMGAIYFIWRWHRREQRSVLSIVAAYAFLGLTFMTKGPVGLLIPFLAFLGYAAYTGEWRILRAFTSTRGWLVFLLIGFPWYIVLVVRHPELVDYFLGRELADRMFTTVHHRNNSFLIYPAVLLGGLLPWTISFVKGWRNAYPLKKLRERKIEPYHAFMLSWILLPLIFFSLVRSRLPLYVLLLFVPMAILAADYLSGTQVESHVRQIRKAVRAALLMSVILVGLQVGASYYTSLENLYPLVEQIRSAGPEHPVIYSNRSDLYSVNFYLNAPITVTSNYQQFLRSSRPAYYILDRKGTQEDLPDDLRGLPVLKHHFNFWLFSNRPILSTEGNQ